MFGLDFIEVLNFTQASINVEKSLHFQLNYEGTAFFVQPKAEGRKKGLKMFYFGRRNLESRNNCESSSYTNFCFFSACSIKDRSFMSSLRSHHQQYNIGLWNPRTRAVHWSYSNTLVTCQSTCSSAKTIVVGTLFDTKGVWRGNFRFHDPQLQIWNELTLATIQNWGFDSLSSMVKQETIFTSFGWNRVINRYEYTRPGDLYLFWVRKAQC